MIRRPLIILLSCLLGPVLALAQDSPSKAELQKKLDALFESKDYGAVANVGMKLLEVDPENLHALHRVGYSLHVLGRYDEALEYHKRGAAIPGEYQVACTYNAACAYALKGDKEQAFDWLNKAIDGGFDDKALFADDPDLASLRADPRFAELAPKVAASRAKSGPRKTVYWQSDMKRAGTRVLVFGDQSPLGQVSIEYGPVKWKDSFAEQIESGELDGKRWRLGDNFWTNLAADVPFTLGDTKVPAGDYYLVLERTGDKYLLTLMPVATVREKKLDSYLAANTKGGTVVELTHADSDKVASTLDIKLATTTPTSTKGNLTIRFGPHVLKTAFSIEV